MSTEIVLRGRDDEWLVDPFSDGLVVDQLALAGQWLDGWKETSRQGNAFARALKDAVLAQMDAQAKWTFHEGGWLFEGASPASGTLVWDLSELEKLLTCDPPLPQERYDEMVVATVSHKVKANEANRIASANPEWKRIIDQARGRRKATRDVQVRWERGAR